MNQTIKLQVTCRTAPPPYDPELYPYLTELLEDAPQVLLDYLAEDLASFDRDGIASATILRLVDRARCLADADRIAMKFAA